jgi:hypothetical protein
MPLSLHTGNEVVGKIPPSRVLGLDRVPAIADPLSAGIRFEGDSQLDLGERDLQLTQSSDQPRPVELGLRVVAIPGVLVDTRGRRPSSS